MEGQPCVNNSLGASRVSMKYVLIIKLSQLADRHLINAVVLWGLLQQNMFTVHVKSFIGSLQNMDVKIFLSFPNPLRTCTHKT